MRSKNTYPTAENISHPETDVKSSDEKNPDILLSEKETGHNITVDDVKNIQSIGRKSVNKFTSEDIAKTEKFARKYFEEMGVKSLFFRAWFGDWRANDTAPVDTIILLDNAQSQRGVVNNTDTSMEISVSKIGIDHIKTHHHNSEFARYIINNLSKTTQKAVLLDSFVSEPTGNTKHKNTAMMRSFYAPIEYNNEKSVVKLFVEEFYNDWNSSIQRRAYDLTKIEVLDDADRFGENNSAPLYASNNTSMQIVSDLFRFVKKNDKDFNPNPVSKLVNGDGTPKVVYHGTSKENGEFFVFDYTKAKKKGGLGLKQYGKGIYFSISDFEKGSRFSERIIKAYVSIQNPYISKGNTDS